MQTLTICDCEHLEQAKQSLMDDVLEATCTECQKTWFGCEICESHIEFETAEEVLEHIAEQHELREEGPDLLDKP